MHVRWQPHNWAEARLMLDPDPNNPSGGGNEGRTKERGSDLLERFGGDAVKMAEKLADALNDNYGYRERVRTLQGEVTTLKANQKPEGATILTGDEASAYEAYKALGKPDEITTRLAERDSLAGELTGLRKGETLREVAEIAGYRLGALKRLGGDLDYVIKEATEDGQTVRQAFVKTAQGEQALADYAAAEWGDFRESLAASDAAPTGQRAQGVALPAMASGSGQRPATGPQVAATYLQSTYQGPPKRS